MVLLLTRRKFGIVFEKEVLTCVVDDDVDDDAKDVDEEKDEEEEEE